MITELIQKIIDGIELRQSISELRAFLKADGALSKTAKLFEGKEELLFSALQNEDAKTRKNMALLLGDLRIQESLHHLMKAYQAEEQLFVKSAYLTAIAKLNYDSILPELKERLNELTQLEILPENKKHIYEEIRTITDMVVKKEGISKHKFIGERTASEIVLLTNPEYVETIADSLEADGIAKRTDMKMSRIGIRLQTNDLHKILPIRTYREILFLVPGMKSCEMEPMQAAKKIAESGLMDFLQERHSGKAPFYFRIEIKSKLDVEKKSIFAKRMAGEIENLTGRKLINSTDHYEVELRLMETKDGHFQCFVKLYTIPDTRFSYRQEYIASSIKPVNAALLVELAKDYMVKDAQILDPFCGVGTMLIERQMRVKGNTSYGIDIYNDAVLKAKVNTEAAGQIIHCVNKDFFFFTHEYLFDEIFTDMPFATSNKPESEIAEIYLNFFAKAREILKPDGIIIMYTHNREMIRKPAAASGFEILKRFEISKKQGTDLVILQ